MNDEEYNSQIEKIAEIIITDNISLDEQNPQKLQKYYDLVKENFQIDGEKAKQLINEAFLYLKLKNSKDLDPLTKGDQFGAGFS